MNKVMLIGRFTRDPELRTTTSQIPVCSFTLAVDRRFKDANGEKKADFITCVAWRQQAEIVYKYMRKGAQMAVVGELQTRSWDDDEGKKHSVTEVQVSEVHFIGNKADNGGQTREVPAPAKEPDGYFPGPDDDTALPFDI